MDALCITIALEVFIGAPCIWQRLHDKAVAALSQRRHHVVDAFPNPTRRPALTARAAK